MAGIATGQLLSFSIGASAEQTGTSFSHIEVYRSRTGAGGPYQEITAPNWGPAELRVPAKSTVINGKVAKFRVNEAIDLAVTFSGTDPISAASIASQIQAQSQGLLLASISGSDLLLQTRQPGAAATLRVVESDGVALLGLSSEEPAAVAFGYEARIPLLAGKDTYTFTDPHGSAAFFYKVRFSNSAYNTVSEYSAPFQPTVAQGLDTSLLATGFVHLIDILGRPMADVTVLISTEDHSNILGGKFAVVGSKADKVTDDSGYVEFALPRGLAIIVAIAGTNLTRRLVVPTDPGTTTFNLLDPSLGSDDLFAVQRPNEEYAVRRAL